MADPPLGRKRLILQSRHHRESRPAALELLRQFHLPLHRDYHPPARVALQGHRLFIHTIYSTRAMTSVMPSPSKGAVRDAYLHPAHDLPDTSDIGARTATGESALHEGGEVLGGANA